MSVLIKSVNKLTYNNETVVWSVGKNNNKYYVRESNIGKLISVAVLKKVERI